MVVATIYALGWAGVHARDRPCGRPPLDVPTCPDPGPCRVLAPVTSLAYLCLSRGLSHTHNVPFHRTFLAAGLSLYPSSLWALLCSTVVGTVPCLSSPSLSPEVSPCPCICHHMEVAGNPISEAQVVDDRAHKSLWPRMSRCATGDVRAGGSVNSREEVHSAYLWVVGVNNVEGLGYREGSLDAEGSRSRVLVVDGT